MKKDKICTHENTVQIGTETAVEVWCTDCNEVVKVGKPFKYTVTVRNTDDREPEFDGVKYKRSAIYAGLKRNIQHG